MKRPSGTKIAKVLADCFATTVFVVKTLSLRRFNWLAEWSGKMPENAVSKGPLNAAVTPPYKS